MNINIDDLVDEVNHELTLYSQKIVIELKSEAKNSMKKLVKQTKSTAPVGNREKHYKDSITSKKVDETENYITYKWYVKGSDYRLSHLLENGHLTRKGKRTKATHFIQKAYDPIEEEYLNNIKEVIENG